MSIRQTTLRELVAGCERKGVLTLRYVHEDHEDVKFNEGRDTGTLGHTGIEAYLRGEDYGKAIQDKMEELPQDDSAGLAKAAKNATLSLASVLSKVDNHLFGVDIVHIEEPWETSFGDVEVSGIWDLVLRDDQLGCVEIVDWKFRKSFTTLSRQDFQGRTYALAAMELLDIPDEYVIHFTHGTIKVNGRGPAAKPPFIRFDTVTYDRDELLNHKMHIELSPGPVVYTNAAAMWLPPRYTGECSWRCPFYNECGILDTETPATLEDEAALMAELGWTLREESNEQSS